MTSDISTISGANYSPTKQYKSLDEYLTFLIDREPNGEFIEIGDNHQTETLTYQQAYSSALLCLSHLDRSGIPENAPLIICVSKIVDLIPVAWASIFGSYDFLPYEFKTTDCNLKEVASNFDTPIIISNQCDVDKINSLFGIEKPTIIPLQTLLRKAPIAPQSENSASETNILISTSGTSGISKVACLGRNFLNRLTSRGVGAKNTFTCFPFHGISGVFILFPEATTSIYVDYKWIGLRANELLKLLSHYKINRIGTSPYLLSAITKSINQTKVKYDLRNLVSIGVGSDLIVKEHISAFVKAIEPLVNAKCTMTLVYGMTECGPLASTTYPISRITQAFNGNQNLVGLSNCKSGWSIRITADNITIPESHVGNIEVYSEHKLFSGYINPNVPCFTEDAWFLTGDRGFIKAGKLYITGRKKNVIRIGSKKIEAERIEQQLAQSQFISNSQVFIKPYRSANNLKDVFDVYFVPKNSNKALIKKGMHDIKTRLYDAFKIYASNVYVINSKTVNRTDSGKVVRQSLNNDPPQRLEKSDFDLIKSAIANEWKSLLTLTNNPQDSDHFFELGGDSLALSSLMHHLESFYDIHFEISVLLKNLTLGKLTDLTLLLQKERSKPGLAHDSELLKDKENLRQVELIMASWRGERLTPESWIVGRNTHGTEPPIFWVFQGQYEFDALAKALGNNRPLYAMKSYSKIIPALDYTPQNIKSLVDKYFLDILSLPVESPIVIGGNCQAGMIALELARKFVSIGKTPKLILVEWMYEFTNYPQPVKILYGKDSHTAKIYRTFQRDINHKKLFPDALIHEVPGKHGQFFNSDMSWTNFLN